MCRRVEWALAAALLLLAASGSRTNIPICLLITRCFSHHVLPAVTIGTVNFLDTNEFRP